MERKMSNIIIDLLNSYGILLEWFLLNIPLADKLNIL